MESSSGALRGSNESVAYRESEWRHQRDADVGPYKADGLLHLYGSQSKSFSAWLKRRTAAMVKSSGILPVCSGMFALRSRDDDGGDVEPSGTKRLVGRLDLFFFVLCPKLLLTEAES